MTGSSVVPLLRALEGGGRGIKPKLMGNDNMNLDFLNFRSVISTISG